MVRILKRAAILFVVFLAALGGYLFWGYRRGEESEVAYTVIEEPFLPVVYAQMYGRRMNPMYGYRQDMEDAQVRGSLTILPQDRQLHMEVINCTEPLLAARYEIRSLDLGRLVEDTRLEGWEEQEDGILLQLPIQNLLTPDKEYFLRLELDMERSGPVYYYTRIVWTEDETAESMIELAADFSEKTFSYDEARGLVTYLETNDAEDNSSFGHTTIRSSFSHLTWGRLDMQPAGEVQLTLKEKDGIMGCVSLSYLAMRVNESEKAEYYEVEENFTMKWGAVRTYLMDYERTVNQVVMGRQGDFSGKRITLGITNDDVVSTGRSANGQILAYRANRDLWMYDQQEKRAVLVFSYRDKDRGDIRATHGEHDIRILYVGDDGDIDFLVYGYHNRGIHEGEFGIMGCRYDGSGNDLKELFFVPVVCSFEQLEADLKVLSYRTANEMLYLYLDHAIYGIDLKSNESMVVADALEDGGYAVSADQARIAWHEGGKKYDAELVYLMDLETGERVGIRGQSEGELVRVLGFVGRDLVYGMAEPDTLWVENGRIVDMPMYALEIMNDKMQVETRYEKPGFEIAEVKVDESRIHLNRVAPVSEHDYAKTQEDTIVCNMDMGQGKLDGIGWYASQELGKVYFVQLDQEIRAGRSIRAVAPKRLNIDESDRLELTSVYRLEGKRFYAYGGGRLLGVTEAFPAALRLAYDRMGIVTDESHQIIWSRVDRANEAQVKDLGAAYSLLERHLGDFAQTGGAAYDDGLTILDARGCTLMQLLYFIGKGMPVAGYIEEGAYLILSGYDQYNVTIYNPVTEESFKAGLNDSMEYFHQFGDDFVCAVK